MKELFPVRFIIINIRCRCNNTVFARAQKRKNQLTCHGTRRTLRRLYFDNSLLSLPFVPSQWTRTDSAVTPYLDFTITYGRE